MNFRTFFNILAIAGLALALPAQAQDLDVGSALQKYEAQKRIADKAAEVASKAKANYNNKQAQFDRADATVGQIRREVRELEIEERQLDSQIANHRLQLSRLQSEIPSLETRISREQSNLSRLQDRRRNLLDRKRTIEQEIDRLSREINDLLNEDPPPTARINRLKTQRSIKQSQVQTVDGDIRHIDRDITNSQRDIYRRNAALTSKKRDLRNRYALLSNAQSRYSRVVADLDRANDNLVYAEGERSRAQTDAQVAYDYYRNRYSEWQIEDSEKQQAYRYYQQVLANYNAERDRILALATNEGRQNGNLEASQRHADAGQMLGGSDGNVAGTSSGIVDGQKREFAEGYRKGRSEASTNSSVRASYLEGKDKGINIAVDKANKEQFPLGYNDGYKATIAGAPDNEVTIDITDSIPTDPGGNGNDLTDARKIPGTIPSPVFTFPDAPTNNPPTAGNPSYSVPPSNGENSNMPCSNLRLPEFESQCRDVYTHQYAISYKDRFQTIYVANYSTEFNKSAKISYENSLANTYPQEKNFGMQDGAREQGVLDGFQEKYQAARQEQYTAGEAAFYAELETSHLVVIKTVSLVEANGDGVSTPGENTKLTLVVDNLGGTATAKDGLRLVVDGTSKLKNINFEIRDLPALAGNTRTILEGVVSAEVATEFAKEKFNLSAKIEKLVGGTFQVIASLNADGETHFPMELETVEVPAAGIDAATIGKFKYKNFSNKTIPLSSLVLSAKDNDVVILSEGLEIPALEPGEETELEVELKPSYWVGKDSKVQFQSHVKISEEQESKQAFLQNINVIRNAGVKLLDGFGRPVVVPEFDVTAGREAYFLVNMDFQATVRKNGPFVLEHWEKSNPDIRFGNNSTTRISYGAWSPGSRGQPSRMAYFFPASLKGQQVWVSVRMLDGGKTSHAIKIKFNVK